MSDKPQWLPLSADDIDGVDQIANAIHVGLPERKEVFVEKLTLFPSGCKKLVLSGHVVGYGISHPWKLFSIPPLDTFLVRIPDNYDCIYIHDVAIEQHARGYRASENYIELIRRVANSLSIQKLACVSVYGTDTLWSRYGFRQYADSSLSIKLQSYGDTAKYMIADA